MVQLAPDYMLFLADTVIAISSFLAGFSATIFITLLTLAKPGTFARIAIGASAFVAVAFIIALNSAVTITFTLHPSAPAAVADSPIDRLRITATIAFLLGNMALLSAIGIAGWIRSRPLGIFTSVLAAIGVLFVLGLLT